MKLKIVTILLFLFLLNEDLSATNYQEGDSLYVVALSGSILRGAPNTKSDKLGKIACKSKVIILDTFGFKNNKDTIEGFSGNWVYVLSEVGKGYVFDAFISTLPLVENLEWYDSMDKDFGGAFEMLPDLLKEYSLKKIGKEGCEYQYRPLREGESWHSLDIFKLRGGHLLIEHGYWEGQGTELELLNKRESEVYYLIRHLLQPIENAWRKKENYIIDVPRNGYEFGNYIKGEGKNYFYQISKKANNKIAILFDFYT